MHTGKSVVYLVFNDGWDRRIQAKVYVVYLIFNDGWDTHIQAKVYVVYLVFNDGWDTHTGIVFNEPKV